MFRGTTLIDIHRYPLGAYNAGERLNFHLRLRIGSIYSIRGIFQPVNSTLFRKKTYVLIPFNDFQSNFYIMRYSSIRCQEVFLKINRAASYLYEIIALLNENTQNDISLTHIHKHKTLHYSVYIYIMSNIINFYLLVLQKEYILLECFFILHRDVILILRK